MSEILRLTPKEAAKIHASEKMLRLVGDRKKWRAIPLKDGEVSLRDYEVIGVRK